ncbi:DNA primase DnaG [Halorarum halobium]|uniref:DNA primase DnaG n=1 Tax=Halorarum halobium TaxID=3075121 RepID=UPI0028B13BD7|nr:DNA primase DnaG [Halobaculum sp. XH14]
MDDSAKYLIHARITADGVVERSDVVGAVFGQTEGLLGDELDLRDLQQSSKVGRIDVHVGSENGQSFGQITISSSLDRVETAILAASLESITRVGPCEARIEVRTIEDMRAAKRREVVDRAKELLADSFDESIMDSAEILEEVREAQRVERIDEYEGLPAGPRVRDSDAIIVVEGRSDVLTLLQFGIKNAVAVEGTNVPDAVADLSAERTVTAFLDGDRGGKLILRELAQVGDVDYVAFAPAGRSVEDLPRRDVMAALREKVPFDTVDLEEYRFDPTTGDLPSEPDSTVSPGTDRSSGSESNSVAATDGSAHPAPDTDSTRAGTESPETTRGPDGPDPPQTSGAEPEPESASDPESEQGGEPEPAADPDPESTPDGAASSAATADAGPTDDTPRTLKDHVREVIGDGSNRARVLDGEYGVVAEVPAAEAFDALSDADERPVTLVLDGELTQRVLDVAAQRGVERIVAESEGEYVKRPTSVRVLTADALLQ